MQSHHRRARHIATALAAALLCPAVWSAPGDPAPAFGDVAWVAALPGLSGPAWSIQPLGDGFIVGGGSIQIRKEIELSRPYYSTTGFIGRIAGNGTLGMTDFRSSLVRDLSALADGSVLGVGAVKFSSPSIGIGGSEFLAFRLTAEGVLDTAFDGDGILRARADLGAFEATSVVASDTGLPVIAGAREGSLVVLRLRADGALDGTFGSGGSFTGRFLNHVARPQIVRVADGYGVVLNVQRTTAAGPVSECSVASLRRDGQLDVSFGNSGYAEVSTHFGGNASCAALLAQSGDRLIVAGLGGGRGFVLRLLADGQRDESFSAPGIAEAMTSATALAAASDDSLFVAGQNAAGAPAAGVIRLHPDGATDPSFGTAGVVWLDGAEIIREILALPNGGVVVAGGPDSVLNRFTTVLGRPFVARLLGPGEISAGLISLDAHNLSVPAGPGQAVVSVHRLHGGAGAVSVAYTTENLLESAEAGLDYVATSGRLDWADGDMADKQIVVQLLGDPPGYSEDLEIFGIRLADVQGGSGLGVGSRLITIAGHEGAQAGVMQLDSASRSVRESGDSIMINVRRDSRYLGAASVTLEASADTASAGSDYRFDATTVEWADGDSAVKTVTIRIINDEQPEDRESFTVRITDATDGAVIGDQSAATITIEDDDQTSSSGGSGGGGSLGFESLLLICLARFLRAGRGAQPLSQAERLREVG